LTLKDIGVFYCHIQVTCPCYEADPDWKQAVISVIDAGVLRPMSRKTILAVAAATGLALAGLGTVSHAQSRPRAETLSGVPIVDSTAQRQNRRGLQWNSEGRWGLNLDVDQPVGREADWNDVDASAEFRLSPSLRLQGTLGLGERRPDPARPQPQNREQPRVRLETIFRF